MGFLRRLFGEGKKGREGDTQGIYFYVQCDHCGSRVRIRADKQYDLNRTDEGFVWHKTIVDSNCFRQIPTVVHLNRNYEVVSAEIEGGRYITREAYEAPETLQNETAEPQEETRSNPTADAEAS
jgi:hypothetical protein